VLRQEKQDLALNNQWGEIIHIPINNRQKLEDTIHQYHPRIIAILVEPILGDGGIRPCSHEFLRAIRQLCDAHGYLMIADEIQTGLCRTGCWSVCESVNAKPDVLVLAKALGNGFPIGAYLVSARAQYLLDGYHGSTFSGNPLGCTVALNVLNILSNNDMPSRVKCKGDYLKAQLETQLNNYPMVRSIRGTGLMIGIELDHPCTAILYIALQYKLLFDVVNDNTIRLLPPLIITPQEMDELVKRLVYTFQKYTQVKHTPPKVA
jgi:acetylornithine/N-succinyldiaminopimelate aminotransferase